jgi:hypothetical protein
MTSKDFTNWLRGYIAGNEHISTKVKNDITKALDSVNDNTIKPNTFGYRVATGGIDVTNTTAGVTTTKTI